MKFRTEIGLLEYSEKISLKDKILTIGSCFANTMGERFEKNKLSCLVNPFGTIYDPLSITRLLRFSMTNQVPDDSTMVESDGVWKNLLLHSSFSGLSKDEVQLQIRAKMTQVQKQLKTADWLIVTFGTAFVYTYEATGQAVANCQKLPARNFTKTLASQTTLLKDFEGFIKELSVFNPKARIILTISPVRHIRDGLVENSTSKAILRVLANSLTRAHKHIFYYPAYEIVLDDLRDYRFYEDDLIHPSSQAHTYIWQHFSKSFFNSTLLDFTAQWQKVATSLQHRPFNPGSYEHQQFLHKLLKELEQLNEQVDLSKEIARVKDQIFEVQ